MLWTKDKHYQPDPFDTEAELEAAVVELSATLFGRDRIYLDIKRRIGAKDKIRNIPDGYLLDLTSRKEPKLYVVENELAKHEPLKHIAFQILQFSISFESSTLKLKGILKDALRSDKAALRQVESYIQENSFENLDYLLESLVNKTDAFNALVIIDEVEDELKTALLSRFKFPVEILTLERFKAPDGQRAYHFDPFLQDVLEDARARPVGIKPSKRNSIDTADIDTIVVPAQEEGFDETFMSENRWYQIRIHASMLPKIKYIAAYRVNPVSAITHYAPVRNIELWKDTSKYVLNFASDPVEIGAVKLVPKGNAKAPQAPRYTSLQRLLKAKNMDQAF